MNETGEQNDMKFELKIQILKEFIKASNKQTNKKKKERRERERRERERERKRP